jgi:hypothetical protein
METHIESPQTELVYEDRLLSHGTRSRPLLGLPLARLIPQDVHSTFDYVGGLTTAVVGALADAAPARATAMMFGFGTIAISLFTDYRMSLWKVVPVEVHETLDYTVGFSNLAAPFVFGYRKRERLVSAVQIFGGAAEVLVALFTDYRGYRRRGDGRER